jgi:hypothetical protein
MKKQIVRLSPHQNGKVFGILMALGSLVLLMPMFVIFKFVAPTVDQHGNQIGFPALAFLVFPFIYLIFGYVSVVIGCALYNFFFKYIGGFEFESQDQDA